MLRICKRTFLHVIITLLVSVLFCEGIVLAQPTYYRSHYITSDDGLSHSEVTCFFKDSQGFMWIGTRQGLNKFDGIKIDVFKPDEKYRKRAGFDLIGAINEDKNEKLWMNILGGNGGVYFYDRKENIFKSFENEIERDSILGQRIDF